jgi:glycosyltransferase involved in cell wall biosynthesis
MTFTIAHVNVSKDFRGGERQTELLIKELSQLNIPQILIARKGGLLASRFDVPNLTIRLTTGDPFSVAFACKGANIVHVHEGRSIYGAYLYSLFTGIPYGVTRRVNNPLGNHFLSYKAYRNAAFVAVVSSPVGDVVQAHDPQIEPKVVYSSSSNLPINKESAKKIREMYPGKFLVGHVGALDNAQKGQEYIIKVARELQDSYRSIHFLLIGGGKDEVMLKKIAADINNLTFIGFVENVGDYLAAFDLFLLPSTKEGIGSILLDAMDQCLPIVASNVGGVPEIVRNNDNGILIEPAQPKKLQAAILHLYHAPELRSKMGQRGQLLSKRFSAKVMQKKYMELYKHALKKTN